MDYDPLPHSGYGGFIARVVNAQKRTQYLRDNLSDIAEISNYDNYSIRKKMGFCFANWVFFCIFVILFESEDFAIIAGLSALSLILVFLSGYKLIGSVECIDVFYKEGKLAVSFPFTDEAETKKYLSQLSIKVRPKQ